MPNTISGYGRGGGFPAAPATANDSEDTLRTMTPASNETGGPPRPISLFPGAVQVGTSPTARYSNGP